MEMDDLENMVGFVDGFREDVGCALNLHVKLVNNGIWIGFLLA